MRFSRLMRIGLMALMLLTVAAVLWSFLLRQQEPNTNPLLPLLSSEIVRRSTKFEYSEHKAGRIIFTINAETSTETVTGLHRLQHVRLAYYGGSGETPSDVVFGNEAIYRAEEKEVEFSGDVRMQLAGGTEVFSESMRADLTQKLATIGGRFHFQRVKMKGAGYSMVYKLPQREIQVLKDFQMVFGLGQNIVEGKSKSAIYRVKDQIIELSGGSHISGKGSNISADLLTISMNKENEIQKIFGVGNCALQMGNRKFFSGHRITGFLGDPRESLSYFKVLSGKSEGLPLRAIYEERNGESRTFLRADRIVGLSTGRSLLEEARLRKITARGDLEMKINELGIKESRADQFVGVFFADGNVFKQINLEGKVSMIRQRNSHSNSTEELQCKTLVVQLDSTKLLKFTTAKGDVSLNFKLPERNWQILAKEMVRIEYQNGLPKRVVARGECQVKTTDPGGSNLMEAPLIEMLYHHGLLERVLGEGGIRFSSKKNGEYRHTRSEKMELYYRENRVKKVIQSGNFKFWQNGPSAIELKSEVAVFDPARHKVILTGDEFPVMRIKDKEATFSLETLAERFELNQKTSEIEGFGLVKSVFLGQDNSTIITADRMQVNHEDGWINYYSSPRITQGANAISGRVVRYSPSKQELLVEGEVRSDFFDDSEVPVRRYRILSEGLTYRPKELRAKYEGEVKLTTDEFMVRAPFLELYFRKSGLELLQKIVTWGGVQITNKNRSAEGEQATYFPYQKKIVLRGNPAKLVESTKGLATGPQLTFFVGDQRIMVESGNSEEP